MKKVYNQPIVDTTVLTEGLMNQIPQSQIVENPTNVQWPSGAPKHNKVF